MSEDPLADLIAWLEPPWQRDALCREYPDLNWFPAKHERLDAQREVCSRCLVQAECYEMAQEGLEHGIWAGTSAKQRRKNCAPRRAA